MPLQRNLGAMPSFRETVFCITSRSKQVALAGPVSLPGRPTVSSCTISPIADLDRSQLDEGRQVLGLGFPESDEAAFLGNLAAQSFITPSYLSVNSLSHRNFSILHPWSGWGAGLVSNFVSRTGRSSVKSDQVVINGVAHQLSHGVEPEFGKDPPLISAHSFDA